MSIIECVPNFSEGRRPEVIERIVAAISTNPRVTVLGAECDEDHNRSVVTFIGPPDDVADAAFRATARAAELIDLKYHVGAHPRMGATDVLPFVPLREATMEHCIAIADSVGERIARELNIPVFLYEHAARRAERRNLADLRRGGFEALRETMSTDPTRQPDFGASVVHPTAGATAVGARNLLVAFNVNLATTDVSIAKRIARAVRGSSGGLRYVKALGLALPSRGIVQVSMNLTNVEATPIHRVFELIRLEAERHGVGIAGGELIGLAPNRAVAETFDHFLRMENFSEPKILEYWIERYYRDRGAPEAPPVTPSLPSLTEPRFEPIVSIGTPDGGRIPTLAAQLAVTIGHAACLGPSADPEDLEQTLEIQRQLEAVNPTLVQRVSEEAQSREAIDETEWLPRDTDADRLAHAAAIGEAALLAATVAFRTAQDAHGVLELLLELSDNVRTADVATAAQLALTAIRTARYRLLELLSECDDEDARDYRARVTEMLENAEVIAMQIELRFTVGQ